MNLNNSTLHHYIMQHIIDVGNAPKVNALSEHFRVSKDEIVNALGRH